MRLAAMARARGLRLAVMKSLFCRSRRCACRIETGAPSTVGRRRWRQRGLSLPQSCGLQQRLPGDLQQRLFHFTRRGETGAAARRSRRRSSNRAPAPSASSRIKAGRAAMRCRGSSASRSCATSAEQGGARRPGILAGRRRDTESAVASLTSQPLVEILAPGVKPGAGPAVFADHADDQARGDPHFSQQQDLQAVEDVAVPAADLQDHGQPGACIAARGGSVPPPRPRRRRPAFAG